MSRPLFAAGDGWLEAAGDSSARAWPDHTHATAASAVTMLCVFITKTTLTDAIERRAPVHA
jgi:hypothetical protein